MEDQRRRRTKACTECRQQKLRCDAHRDYSKPCSRCRRMDLTCVISNAYKRTRKLTRAEMQREIHRLQDQVQAQNAPRPSSTESQTSVPAAAQDIAVSTPPIQPIQVPVAPSQDVLRTRPQPRVLEDLELPADKIESLFSLYFTKHSPFLPIIDEHPPDWCYEKSPLLFWAIAYVGSRRHEDATLMMQLAPRVITLAFSSLALSVSPSQTIHVIQGLLLICAWPAPVDTQSKDVSQMLGSAALQFAIRAGLHIFGNGQEFSRTVFQQVKDDSSYRARLWAYCLIVCQSLNIGNGLPPLTALDSFDFGRKHPELWASLTSGLQLRLKLHRIQVDALSKFARGGFMTESTPENSEMLSSFIELYDERLLELDDGTLTDHDKVLFNSARLHIHVFRWFSEVVDKTGFIKVFYFACNVLEDLNRLEATCDFATNGPIYDMWIIMLAAFSILRLLRSELKPYLDAKRGEQAYLTGIHLHHKRSVQNNDLQARGAVIMTQLWSSERIFKRADGLTDCLRLRIRNRLSLGVVFDCYWWWRAEFGGQANLFEAPSNEQGVNSVSTPATEPLSLLLDPSFMAQNRCGFPVDPTLGVIPDWDWTASFDMPWDSLMGA